MNNLKNIIYFGEKVKGYKMRVLNEREIRAGAGILFFFALISFLNFWFTGSFTATKIFVIVFLIDLIIRVFVNPKYSPSLILGRLAVGNQIPEYVAAEQKKSAWILGIILGTTLFVLLVIFNITGPLNMLICLTCLTLLFLESSFGICVGCLVYNKMHKKKAKLCAGGICEIREKDEIQKVKKSQIIILIIFFSVLILTGGFGISSQENELKKTEIKQNLVECEIPKFVKFIGFEERYKTHNNCK